MKILLTSDWFTPAVNGVVVSFMNLYKELKEMGHDVRILTLSSSDHSYREGDYYFVRSFGFAVYPNVRATVAINSHIVDMLIDWKPDIVHSQCEFFTYSLAYKIAKASNAPIVHTYHTLYEYYTKYVIPNEKLGRLMVANLMKYRLDSADAVIAPTTKVLESLKSHGLSDNIYIIPTGINLTKYDLRVSDLEKSMIREEYNIPQDHKIIINIGRIANEKNLDEVVKNFKMLLQVYDKVTLMIVGDGPYMKDLKDLTQDLGIIDHVRFTGMVEPNDTYKYYQTGDIFVSASISETQGLTYVEALANSLPEICRSDEAIKEVIEHGKNGYIYNNESEFVKYFKDLLTDDEKRMAFSKYAKESSNKFSTEVFGKTVFELYEDVLKNFSPDKRRLKLVNLAKNIKINPMKFIKRK